MSETVDGDSKVQEMDALERSTRTEITRCLSDELDGAKQGSTNCIPVEDKTSEAALICTTPATLNNDSIPDNYRIDFKNPKAETKSEQNVDDPSPTEANDETHELDELGDELKSQEGQDMPLLKVMTIKATDSSQSAVLNCSHCNFQTSEQYMLSRHMKSHSDDCSHACSICGRVFKNKNKLQDHMNAHQRNKPFACLSCDSRFIRSGDLARHVRYKHSFAKRHECSECDYSSVEISKLQRHMRSHTGERPHKCPHCSYASPDNFKLQRHLRTHTGERPYECDMCHARFAQSNTLKCHKLIHNVDDRPVFYCALCPTTCGLKAVLRRHVKKQHYSETPIVCSRCGKNFPDRYSYKMHKKTHGGERRRAKNNEECGVIEEIEESEDDSTLETLEPTISKAQNVKNGIMVKPKQEQTKENQYDIKIEADLAIETLEPTTSKAHNFENGIMVQPKQKQVKENQYGIKIEDDLTIETLEPTTSKAYTVKNGIMAQLNQEQLKENDYGIKIENEFQAIDEND
ncbi:PREDICTED: transcriptional repressor CTCF-like isoform X1 [Rhagoletis zephyria]|uniref:transcriptional repressor CTCF-like isoform X1 n=1 Tax=Rhagoletis zephyria TaxID=28612 RepID=UPI00081136BD|nr:PREDICTED: transcriptional repressor CTCF-like isoform X1 [Rhagoletis zephyria]